MKKKWIFNFHTDMSMILLVSLAAMVIPRVVVGDLQLLPVGSTFYLVLVVVPYLVYFTIALLRRTERPFYDFIVLGIVIGLIIGATHLVVLNSGESITDRLIICIRGLLIGLRKGLIYGSIAYIVGWIHKWRANKVKGDSLFDSTSLIFSSRIQFKEVV